LKNSAAAAQMFAPMATAKETKEPSALAILRIKLGDDSGTGRV
jgi:predicted pyridoxine 5'-phosphate oxidase superfamily flavin-nucleotide-binding protein